MMQHPKIRAHVFIPGILCRNRALTCQVKNICAPRDDALGPIETTAGEHHRSLNGFVPVPPRDYRAQNSGQLNNVVAVEKTPRYSTSVVCKTSWQGTSLINLNL